MRRFFGVSFLGFLIVVPALLGWAESKKADLNGDGYKEAVVFSSEKKIGKIYLDLNKDGRYESIVYYDKNGHKERAENDTDLDGQTDQWVYYYFTGVPWKIAEDLNHDGKPDYWQYLKDGRVYKWEEDRLGSGKPDVRTIYEWDHDGKRVLSQQSYDNDSDGVFESLSGITMTKRLSVIPHSLAEALLR